MMIKEMQCNTNKPHNRGEKREREKELLKVEQVDVGVSALIPFQNKRIGKLHTFQSQVMVNFKKLCIGLCF